MLYTFIKVHVLALKDYMIIHIVFLNNLIAYCLTSCYSLIAIMQLRVFANQS